jgi:hypothetical protein
MHQHGIVRFDVRCMRNSVVSDPGGGCLIFRQSRFLTEHPDSGISTLKILTSPTHLHVLETGQPKDD